MHEPDFFDIAIKIVLLVIVVVTLWLCIAFAMRWH